MLNQADGIRRWLEMIGVNPEKVVVVLRADDVVTEARIRRAIAAQVMPDLAPASGLVVPPTMRLRGTRVIVTHLDASARKS